MKSLAVFIVVIAATSGFGQASGGIGIGGNCSELNRTILRSWFDVRDLMAGGDTGPKRPKARDFNCISPYYIQNAIPKQVPGVRGKLKCFQLQGVGVCCDNQLRECASL